METSPQSPGGVTHATWPNIRSGLRAPYQPGKLGAAAQPGPRFPTREEPAMSENKAPATETKPANEPTAPVTVNITSATEPTCLCGCGTSRDATGSRFVPGHDQRTLGILLQAHRDGANLLVVTSDNPDGTLVTPEAYAKAAFSAGAFAKYQRHAANPPKPKGKGRKQAADKPRDFSPEALTGAPATTKLAESKSQAA